jgi:hypothetical protein
MLTPDEGYLMSAPYFEPDSSPFPVRQVVSQQRFDTLEDFIRGSNNFSLYFRYRVTDQLLAEAYGGAPPFRRFVQQHPERVAELRRLIEVAPERRPPNLTSHLRWQLQQRLDSTATLPPEASIWPKLYEAYQLMAELVDQTDPGVYRPDPHRQQNDGYDTWYLCR